MRVPSVAFGVSFAVLCTSYAATRQGDPLAEQQFKNIVSFKGKKASDIVPAMQFMSASLKVDCDYCHVADRASDEKREKKTAREMIAMQNEINDKNFNGRNQVTCATCHAGHTHPVGVPPITGLDIRTRRSADVAADQVLATYAKAQITSGATPVQAVVIAGKTTTEGKTSRFEATYLGEKFVRTTHAAGVDKRQGFDGTTAWFSQGKEVQKVPLVYAIQYVRQSMLFLSPETLPKQQSPTGGTSKIEGKEMLVLTGTIVGSNSRAAYFFDKGTGLLARATFYYPTILGSIEQINDYSDYHKFKGFEIPAKITNRSPEGDTVTEVTFMSVDPTVDAAKFASPDK